MAFSQVAGAWFHTCAVTAGGQAYCWGKNDFGELGDGSVFQSSTPVAVHQPAGVAFARIGGGRDHTCALTGGGQACCWGSNLLGQIGDGTFIRAGKRTPVAVNQPAGVAFGAFSAGYMHNCGLASGGQVYCWGSNVFGEVGTGSMMEAYSSPMAVRQ